MSPVRHSASARPTKLQYIPKLNLLARTRDPAHRRAIPVCIKIRMHIQTEMTRCINRIASRTGFLNRPKRFARHYEFDEVLEAVSPMLQFFKDLFDPFSVTKGELPPESVSEHLFR